MVDVTEGAAGDGEAAAARRFELFFELSLDLLSITGRDGRFRRLNRAWEELLGHPRADLYRMSWSDLVHPDDQARTLDEFRRADKTARMFFENRYRHKDGSYRWLEWSTIRIDAEGVYYAVARDVTERRREQERLRASEAYRAAVHEASTDAIVAFDGAGRVADFNAAAERMYGYRAGNVVGQLLQDFAIPPDTRGAFQADLARYGKCQSGIVDFRVERVGLRADGARFPTEVTVTRLADARTLYAAFIRDLTDAKRAEEERRSLESQFRHAQKMEAVGRLAGSVAHDFGDLLNAISAFADAAGSALQTGPARERLEQMKKATERAVALVDQLLAFGRRQSLAPEVLDVNAIIIELEHILRGLTGDGVTFQLVLDPEAAHVRADPAQLQQALVNIVVNAHEAMRAAGRLRITTANVTLAPTSAPPGVGAKPGPYVRISIEDNGSGMTEEVASRAFEPFFTTKEATGSSGLGLSTVYGIVAQSGGFVRIETAPGRGTIVHVHLPAVDETPVPVPDAPARATVLLVEDDEAVRQLVRRILEERGYQVLLARHGGEALEIIHQVDQPIELMLTDAVMPVLSGPELLRRAIALRPTMKLAIMSGYTDKPAWTGIPFIAKPFTPAELSKRVREILDAPAPTPPK
ncbi:MAG TPA: PAS domain S-box protein [Polyangia bacterium]|nr:PAS domain S-box protein [Polyangia bacterium]